jgi:RNA polymerase sigma-70 factor (ECF subfamily)
MSAGDPSGALRDIRTLFGAGRLGGLTDRQLLDRFVNRYDVTAEEAFAILLERHGPMVWGVCRRLLGDRHAAADAFQATFLVLVRRAPVVRVDDSLGPWLYGVSRRVAARVRTTSLRRGARETGGVEAVADPAPDRHPDPGAAEMLAVLDEEIGRLPERYRAAIVLCDLEGLPHEEAARRLGCPVGTVESRLSRGRRRLRDRLVWRGVAPAAAALWAETAREVSAATPAALVRQSVQFATSPAGAVPAAAATLAEGMIQMMWVARLKPLAAVAAALLLATAGVAVQGRQQPAPQGEREPRKTASAPAAGAGGAAVPHISAN